MEDRVGQDELARIDAQDIGKEPRGFGLGKPEDACGNINPGKRQQGLAAGTNAGQRHQIVGFRGRKQFLLGDRAWSDEAHDVALNDGFSAAFFRFRGILDLLADGDAEAE